MFDYTSKDGTIRVYEGSAAFYVVLLETGEEACMGDGVDMYSDDDTGPFYVGDPEYYAAMKADIDTNTSEWIEAYFGTDGCRQCGADIDDGEGYDGLCGDCADRKDN